MNFTFTLPKNQSDVAATMEAIKIERERIRYEMSLLDAAQAAVQRLCKHPNQYNHHHYYGSTSENCPDCGWCD
jgi:hypothetical protein